MGAPASQKTHNHLQFEEMGPTPWAKIVALGASQASLSVTKGGADGINSPAKAGRDAGVKGGVTENGPSVVAADLPKPCVSAIDANSVDGAARKESSASSANKSDNSSRAAAAQGPSNAKDAKAVPRETESKDSDRSETSASPSKPLKPAWNTALISANADEDPARPPLADIQHGAPAPWPTLNDSKSQPKRSKSPEAAAQGPKDASSDEASAKRSQHCHSNNAQSRQAGRHNRHQQQGGVNGNVRNGSRNDRYGGHGGREGGRGRRSGPAYNMNNNNAAYYSYGPSREYVTEVVRAQIEYYFSVENLCKDVFLRAKMDSNGYIALGVISSFNRVRMLTTDVPFIVESLQSSTVVELSEDNMSIRVRNGHEQWVLPQEQLEMVLQLRSPTARSEGNMSEGSTPTDVSKENYADDGSSSKTTSSDGMEDISVNRMQGQNQMSLNLFGDAPIKGCDAEVRREALPMAVIPSTAAGA